MSATDFGRDSAYHLPARVQCVPLYHSKSFNEPPPPVTLVPNVVQVPSAQLPARPSVMLPIMPWTGETGSWAKVEACARAAEVRLLFEPLPLNSASKT